MKKSLAPKVFLPPPSLPSNLIQSPSLPLHQVSRALQNRLLITQLKYFNKQKPSRLLLLLSRPASTNTDEGLSVSAATDAHGGNEVHLKIHFGATAGPALPEPDN